MNELAKYGLQYNSDLSPEIKYQFLQWGLIASLCSFIILSSMLNRYSMTDIFGTTVKKVPFPQHWS